MRVKPEKGQWVRPIAGETVEARPHAWGLTRFSTQRQQHVEALEAEVLARMRAELQPKLDAELAELRRQAREAGFAEGRQAGYEAGLEAGRREAEAAVREEQARWLAQSRETVEVLTDALQRPFGALEDALTAMAGEVIDAAIETLIAARPDWQQAIVARALTPVLSQLQQASLPIVVRAHPQLLDDLRALLPETVRLEADGTLEAGRIEVHQGDARAVIDWRQQLAVFREQLHQQLNTGETDDASVDTEAD